MKPKQTAQTSLIDKLCSGGPEAFTKGEIGELLAAFENVTQENLQLQRAMYGISEALTRHNLQVNHTTNPDGSMGFDLENVPDTEPDTEPITVN